MRHNRTEDREKVKNKQKTQLHTAEKQKITYTNINLL